jgi:hypothetical protein
MERERGQGWVRMMGLRRAWKPCNWKWFLMMPRFRRWMCPCQVPSVSLSPSLPSPLSLAITVSLCRSISGGPSLSLSLSLSVSLSVAVSLSVCPSRVQARDLSLHHIGISLSSLTLSCVRPLTHTHTHTQTRHGTKPFSSGTPNRCAWPSTQCKGF